MNITQVSNTFSDLEHMTFHEQDLIDPSHSSSLDFMFFDSTALSDDRLLSVDSNPLQEMQQEIFESLEFAAFGMEDLLSDKGRRLSMELSRRLSLSSMYHFEQDDEPFPKRRKSEKDLSFTARGGGDAFESHHPFPEEITSTATTSCASDKKQHQILSLMSPSDLEIHLEQTRTRLADSMKRSALSRRHINDQAAKILPSENQQHPSSSSAVLFQSPRLQIASFIGNITSKTL